MKKFISVVVVLLLVSSITVQANNQPVVEVVDTQELPDIHYLTDEELSRLYTCKQDVRKSDSTIVELSQEDAWKMMKIAECEDNTDSLSQAYIMTIVLNRLDSEDFPNDIDEILAQENQFSSYSDGRYAKAEPNVDSHYALYLVESGQVRTDYLFFEASTLEDSWQSNNREYACTYGGTTFYY